MSYLIYTDLISCLLDPRLVDPGSTLIHVGAYDPRWCIRPLACIYWTLLIQNFLIL